MQGRDKPARSTPLSARRVALASMYCSKKGPYMCSLEHTPAPTPVFVGFEPATAPISRHVGENLFFNTQFIILQVISKNYNLLVEVPFYTRIMVSKIPQ